MRFSPVPSGRLLPPPHVAAKESPPTKTAAVTSVVTTVHSAMENPVRRRRGAVVRASRLGLIEKYLLLLASVARPTPLSVTSWVGGGGRDADLPRVASVSTKMRNTLA